MWLSAFHSETNCIKNISYSFISVCLLKVLEKHFRLSVAADIFPQKNI